MGEGIETPKLANVRIHVMIMDGVPAPSAHSIETSIEDISSAGEIITCLMDGRARSGSDL